MLAEAVGAVHMTPAANAVPTVTNTLVFMLGFCTTPARAASHADEPQRGWFADIELSDSMVRAKDFKRLSAAGRLPRDCTSWEQIVIGRVALVDVVPYRPPLIVRRGNAEVERLARHGTIRELAILGELDGGAGADVIAELSERYEVRVFMHPQTAVPGG